MGVYIQYFLGCWATAKWVTTKWHGTELTLIIASNCWHRKEGLATEPEVGDIPGPLLCIASTGNEKWKLIPCLLFPSKCRGHVPSGPGLHRCPAPEISSPEQGFQLECSLGPGEAEQMCPAALTLPRQLTSSCWSTAALQLPFLWWGEDTSRNVIFENSLKT